MGYMADLTEYTVLVFDICSSTVFIEDLVKTGELEAYCILVEDFRRMLAETETERMLVYKFLGDGFILLFHSDVMLDGVLHMAKRLAEFATFRLNAFTAENVETTAIPRVGITIGIDIGVLHSIELDGSREFIGRALNLASRLQGSLKEEEHVYKILMSVKAYKRISDPEIKRQCIERERIFRNISENNRTRCYELSAQWA